MDEYNLVFFICAILDNNNSTSSTSIPNAVLRHGINDSKKTTGAVNAQQVATKELHDNVCKISQSMVTIATASNSQQINRLESERFQLDIKILDLDIDDDSKRIELYGRCIAKLTSSISLLNDSMIGGEGIDRGLFN